MVLGCIVAMAAPAPVFVAVVVAAPASCMLKLDFKDWIGSNAWAAASGAMTHDSRDRESNAGKRPPCRHGGAPVAETRTQVA